MKSDGLEADEVVAAGDSRWDGRSPGRVLSNHNAVTPNTVVDRAVDETGLVDLELHHI